MAAIPELAQPLSDGIVSLRPYAERDIPEILIAYQDDPELHLRLGQEKPPSGAQLGHRAEIETEERAAGVHATLTILEPGADTCRGQVNIHQIDWDHALAELGLRVAPQVRRRRAGPSALRRAPGWRIRAG